MPGDRYQFGDFTVDTACASLTCGGVAVALRPKCFALLEYLVSHAGRLVGKDELHGAVWPGVVVTDDSLTRCVSDVRSALGDRQQQIIKTVSRRGYLFAAPVVALGSSTAAAAAAAAAKPPRDGGDIAAAAPARQRVACLVRPTSFWLPLLLLLTLALLPGWRRAQPAAPRLSVAVLPFATSGAVPAALADALTDDLTGALARLHRVHVASSNNAGAWKGRQVDVRQVGSDLGVRYAVEGSVVLRSDRHPGGSGDQLHVNARLVDTQTAASLWSDQFDVEAGGRPAAHDEIVLRLASALDVELVGAHSQRVAAADPLTWDAEDLALQCVAASRVQAGESGAPAYSLCRQALQEDPNNVRALARLGWYHADRVSRGQTSDAAGDLALAGGYAARALAADDGYSEAHCAQAAVLEGRHRVRDAIAAARRCLELNPSSASAYRALMVEHFFVVEPEQTLAYANRLTRLSPRDPRLATVLLFKGWACLQLGRPEEAVSWLRSASANAPASPNIRLALAVALVFAGRDAEARDAMTTYLGLPRTRARTVAQWDHRPDDNAAFAAFAGRVNAALRTAGMPP